MINNGTHDEVISAYFWGSEGPNTGHNVFFEGDILYSYGHHFPLAIRLKCGTYLINGDNYSVTTSHHQSIVQQKCRNNNSFTTSLSALESHIRGNSRNARNLSNIITLLDKKDDYSEWLYDKRKKDIHTPIPSGATRFYHLQEKPSDDPNSWIYNINDHRAGGSLLKIRYIEVISAEHDYSTHSWVEGHHLDDRRYLSSDVFQTAPRTEKRRSVYVICGMDDASFFVSQLPKRAKSIDEAFEILKPKSVKRAEKAGLETKRQGEWFFVEVETGKPARKLYNKMHRAFTLPLESQWSNPHTATRGMIRNRQVLVSGQVDHPEHPRLSLSYAKSPSIFRAFENTALANFSMSGVD